MALGALVLFSALLGLIAGSFFGGGKSLPKDMILTLNIAGAIGETSHSRSFTDPLASPAMTVRGLVDALDRASVDKRVHALAVNLDSAAIELAHVEELRAAVKRFKDKGKPAYIYTPSFADLGSGIGAYYFASAFDEIWMQPAGHFSMTGVAVEMPFLKELLDKVGARAQFIHREEFKSAMESFTHTHMSPENRAMTQSILDDLTGRLARDIQEDRGLSSEDFMRYRDTGLLAGRAALEAGLITRLDYDDVLMDELRKKLAGSIKQSSAAKDVLLEDYYYAVTSNDTGGENARVALVQVSGQIVAGRESEPGLATGEYIASGIREAMENESIKVIVVRVNSPGGMPSASETIRHAIVQAQEAGKKVIVSMGPVAASGGYWLAVDADKIYALPSTLTGSIGVIMGKFEISGLWEKIGIGWDGIAWGRNAHMWSMNAPLDDSALRALNDAIDETYDDFLSRVAKGRDMDAGHVRTLAKGRAWTGAQALENGLVDALGGLDAALDEAAQIANIPDRIGMEILQLPRPLSPFEQFMRLVGGNQVSFAALFPFFRSVEPEIKKIEAMRDMGPVQVYAPDLPRLIM